MTPRFPAWANGRIRVCDFLGWCEVGLDERWEWEVVNPVCTQLS